jgi:glycosyltransferase involved in cell wall biosynthesis
MFPSFEFRICFGFLVSDFGFSPMVSFIIPAHNESLLLPATLRALSAAAATALREPHETIVVDDASTDATATIARQHGARVIPVNHRQIAATRNAGARAARGDLLIFIDADTTVTPAALRAAVAAVRQRGAIGGGCAFRFDPPVPLYGRIVQAVAEPLYRALGLASGCFLFCTRPAFDAAGGFDQTLYAAEEAALSLALHKQGRFVFLKDHVTTSARKLRTHSPREALVLFLKMARSGPNAFRRREGLDLWYGPRRPDPAAPAGTRNSS